MAGMPPMDLSGLPPGIKLPPQAMMFSGKANRLLNIRLWSPTIAPANATASVAPPAGLKQGAKLDLELYGRVNGQGDGDGRSLPIELREGKHIEFDTADVKSTFFAGKSGSKGRITGVRLRTRQGPAPIDGEVAVTMEQKVIQNVMTKATSGCTLSVVDLSQ